MDGLLIPLGCLGTALAITALATARLLPWLIRRQLVDAPNERSSHKIPKPRGAGPALMLGLLGAAIIFGPVDWRYIVLGIAALVLCGMGFLDDKQSLSARYRLIVQAAVAGICTLALPADLTLGFDLWPLWLERCVIWIGWVWIINLTNFMDGIDGICGVQMAYVGAGIGLASAILFGEADILGVWAFALSGAGIGFLTWNWPPSRLFMGDSGSLPLGLISGALTIELSLRGAPITALLLNGVFWSDATLTLARRAFKRQAIWRAHRQHSYQRLSQFFGGTGQSDHHRALWVVIVLNAWLFLFAIEALDPNRAYIALGFGIVLLAAYHGIVEKLKPMV